MWCQFRRSKKIFITPKSNIKTIDFVRTLTGDPESVIENITGITMVTGTPSAVFYTYNFRPNTANVVSTATVDQVNGSTFFNNVLTMQWNKFSTEKRVEFETIARSEDLVVMFQDANLKIYLFNYNYNAYLTNGSMNYGTAKADLSGHQLELTAEELFSPIEVNMSNIDSILDQPL